MLCEGLPYTYKRVYSRTLKVYPQKVRTSYTHYILTSLLTPRLEEAKATENSSRLIPPYDENASRPDDVYKLHDIIPEAEFNALSITPRMFEVWPWSSGYYL